jgi:hypothetical protein
LQANQNKEDQIIMTNLTSKTPMPSQAEEKKTWQRNIVGLILNATEPNSVDHIFFTAQG